MLRSSQARGRGNRPPQREIRQNIIIVCEGKKTEPGYFRAIRRALRLRTVRVEIYHPDATDPRSIVEYAAAKRKEFIDDKNWVNQGDSAWAVYDGEEHFRTDERRWHEALDMARGNGISLAVSNPCFEFWYLLHFQDQNAFISRDAARRQLGNWIREYDKAMILYPDPLKPLTEGAVTRARKLAAYAAENELKLHECLCAEGVANLVEMLHKLR